jgi:hypothetical protein
MKKVLFLVLFVICLVSCKTTEKFHNPDFKIIKYYKLGKVKYDMYDSHKIVGNYCVYYKKSILGTATNYVYGDFEIMGYIEYKEER